MPENTPVADGCPDPVPADLFVPGRLCPNCGKLKPLGGFHKDRQRKDGIRLHCKVCVNAALTERVSRNGDKYKDMGHRNTYKHMLRTKYGLTVHEFALMLDAQNLLCAICKRPESRAGRGGNQKSLSVDHCHTTGKVRMLLCDACNKGLGCFKDDPALLQEAARYLLLHADDKG